MAEDASPAAGTSGCGCFAGDCVFAKALRLHVAECELVRRESLGEGDALSCSSPTARINCATLAALMRERATFALRLPREPAPLMHAKALQLHCGGLTGLRRAVDPAGAADVHRLVAAAHERWGSLTELPWDDLVHAIAAWSPQRRGPKPR